MTIYGYSGTPEELAISLGRQPEADIGNLLDLLADELYKKACKDNKSNLITVVDHLDLASKLLAKTKLEIIK